MWMFNPGNPTRGTTKTFEVDEQPVFLVNRQVSVPPAFRFTISDGGGMGQWYPFAVGSHSVVRYYPNGKFREDFSLSNQNSFSYLQVGNSSSEYNRTYVGVLPAGYFFAYYINGELVAKTSEMTLDGYLSLLSENGISTQFEYYVREGSIFDTEAQSSINVTLVVFSGKTLQSGVSVTIRYENEDADEDYLVLAESSEYRKGWHVEWIGGVAGAIQRPFLMFNQWIIGDLPDDWQGPRFFDVLSPVDLDLYELEISRDELNPGAIVRGQLLGKTRLYPAWP